MRALPLACAALVVLSAALTSTAFARGAAGGGAGGGSGGGSGGAGGGGGGDPARTLAISQSVAPPEGHRHPAKVAPVQALNGSCYKREMFFDRFGYPIGGLPSEECFR